MDDSWIPSTCGGKTINQGVATCLPISPVLWKAETESAELAGCQHSSRPCLNGIRQSMVEHSVSSSVLHAQAWVWPACPSTHIYMQPHMHAHMVHTENTHTDTCPSTHPHTYAHTHRILCCFLLPVLIQALYIWVIFLGFPESEWPMGLSVRCEQVAHFGASHTWPQIPIPPFPSSIESSKLQFTDLKKTSVSQLKDLI